MEKNFLNSIRYQEQGLSNLLLYCNALIFDKIVMDKMDREVLLMFWVGFFSIKNSIKWKREL